MRERQFLVRGLSYWVLGKRFGEFRRLDDDPLLEILDEFNLYLITRRHPELPKQVLAEAEVALAAVDHEPRAIFHAVHMCEDLRPLAGKGCGYLFGYNDGVAAALSR